MNTVTLDLDLKEHSDLYYSLLQEEDFDFRNKEVFVKVDKEDSNVLVTLETGSILELKIGMTAVMKSLEVIDKTLQV